MALAGAIFGVLTLIAAAYAAWYARRAADAGHNANEISREANKIAWNAQRPWLGCRFQVSPMVTRMRRDAFDITLNLVVQNTGSSPAVRVSQCIGRAFFNADGSVDTARFIEESKRYHQSMHTALAPGQSHEFAQNTPLDFVDYLDDDFNGPDGAYSYWAGASYQGQKADEIHCTILLFSMTGDAPKGGEGFAQFQPGYFITQTLMS